MTQMTHNEILYWLKETNEQKLESLWRRADDTRKATVGDAVNLRGLIEISSYCVRQCGYCGLAATNQKLQRYRMTDDEILACVSEAVRLGYGTVVMQSGEDYAITADRIAGLIRQIKQTTKLAVTLSLGERPDEDLALWKAAGADRYLLRFETSDAELYERIHPSLPGRKSDRFEILAALRTLGYEVGSGVMIGIPGQTYDSLARDIEWFAKLDLDMIGVGPFIAHPDTPLGQSEIETQAPSGSDGIKKLENEIESSIRRVGGFHPPYSLKRRDNDYPTSAINTEAPSVPAASKRSEDRVPNTELMTYKVVALTRLVCPQANIPSTTALATINRDSGRELGLMRGANVVMPNLTPPQYRTRYEIYPGKACINETAEQCANCLNARIAAIGRTIASGPGGRKRNP
jgi:biotin synthase